MARKSKQISVHIRTSRIHIAKVAKHQKYKKQTIPKQYKEISWTKYIGEYVSSLCPCCQITKISVWDCEYGHIIAEKKGGLTIPNNLIPVCRTCNSQMGTTDMREYSKKKFGKQNTLLTMITTKELYDNSSSTV